MSLTQRTTDYTRPHSSSSLFWVPALQVELCAFALCEASFITLCKLIMPLISVDSTTHSSKHKKFLIHHNDLNVAFINYFFTLLVIVVVSRIKFLSKYRTNCQTPVWPDKAWCPKHCEKYLLFCSVKCRAKKLLINYFVISSISHNILHLHCPPIFKLMVTVSFRLLDQVIGIKLNICNVSQISA